MFVTLAFLLSRYSGRAGSDATQSGALDQPPASPLRLEHAAATTPAQAPAPPGPNIPALVPPASAPVEKPGAFPGITVIDFPEPPPPPVATGTPRTPLKIFPNPAGVGGFVAETDETWAVSVYPPPPGPLPSDAVKPKSPAPARNR